jgi:hypothetical protein
MVLWTSLASGCGGSSPSASDDTGKTDAIETSARRATASAASLPPPPAEATINGTGAAQFAGADSPTVAGVRAGAVRRFNNDAVDCAYVVQVRNGSVALRSLAVDLKSSGSSSGIVSGRVTIGALAPGQTATSDESIVLRDRAACSIDLSKARWGVDAIPSSAERGVLLAGAPGLSAVSAVIQMIDNEPRARGAEGGALRFTAVIDDGATVGQVNDALRVTGVRIVQMTQGSRNLMLEAQPGAPRPRPQEIQTRLAASQAFESINGVALRPQHTADVPLPPQVDDHQQPQATQ